MFTSFIFFSIPLISDGFSGIFVPNYNHFQTVYFSAQIIMRRLYIPIQFIVSHTGGLVKNKSKIITPKTRFFGQKINRCALNFASVLLKLLVFCKSYGNKRAYAEKVGIEEKRYDIKCRNLCAESRYCGNCHKHLCTVRENRLNYAGECIKN